VGTVIQPTKTDFGGRGNPAESVSIFGKKAKGLTPGKKGGASLHKEIKSFWNYKVITSPWGYFSLKEREGIFFAERIDNQRGGSLWILTPEKEPRKR